MAANRTAVLELLRPPAHRGPLIAAGAVPLTLGVALEELRLSDEVATGVHLLILAAAAALMLGLGLQARPEGGRPPAFQSVLLVCGLGLLYPALLTLADVLGADFDDFPAGAFVWASLLQAGAALWPAVRCHSAICALIAAVAVGIALLSAIDWIFDPDGTDPFRWALVVLGLAYALTSMVLRAGHPRHAEQMVNAVGLAILAIPLIAIAAELVAVPFGDPATGALLPNGWELLVLAVGCGLIAYGAVDRAPGPAWLGVANVAGFLASAAPSDEQTLRWWPLILLALGAATMAAGLRPRVPLPPEPAGYRAGDLPPSVRSDDEETVVRVRDDSPPQR
jgi:hypothetical protein